VTGHRIVGTEEAVTINRKVEIRDDEAVVTTIVQGAAAAAAEIPLRARAKTATEGLIDTTRAIVAVLGLPIDIATPIAAEVPAPLMDAAAKARLLFLNDTATTSRMPS
jgi:hypothetical protein